MKIFYTNILVFLIIITIISCNSSYQDINNTEISSSNNNQYESNTSNVVVKSNESNMKENILQKNVLDLPVEKQVNGGFFKAILNSYNDFMLKSNLPEEKKNIENYEILVRQNKNEFIISFVAKRLKEELNLDGGESALGKDVVYIINKNDYSIKQSYFVR